MKCLITILSVLLTSNLVLAETYTCRKGPPEYSIDFGYYKVELNLEAGTAVVNAELEMEGKINNQVCEARKYLWRHRRSSGEEKKYDVIRVTCDAMQVEMGEYGAAVLNFEGWRPSGTSGQLTNVAVTHPMFGGNYDWKCTFE